MIRLLDLQDYDAWIELAEEVEPLFGPMTDSKEFQNGIKDCILNKNAFGLENEKGNLTGIVAIDRANNEIMWLAVAKKHRGNNYGEKLVKKAIEELESNGDIYVQTFSGKVNIGKNARKIYESNGFADFKDAGRNPAGIETVMMIRKEKNTAPDKAVIKHSGFGAICKLSSRRQGS
ncbi:MAG TPA: GNAT family N-acetyltransferase [Bacteroidales bacterium]|nr:GNAT family N-acetyltransferase [Bacteroidales bacterium]HPT02132.1 GNAT family N-acetyltransferase [Bacteroidales bacterium]